MSSLYKINKKIQMNNLGMSCAKIENSNAKFFYDQSSPWTVTFNSLTFATISGLSIQFMATTKSNLLC